MNGRPTRHRSPDVHATRLGPVLGFMRALWEVDHALASASKQMKRRLGVSGPERLVIRIVGHVPGISPGELASIMHVDPSSLTGLLKRMVRRKLIARHSDPADARRSHLQLTSAGAALDRVRGGTVELTVRTALDAVSPRDVATTVAVLGTLVAALSGSATGTSRPTRQPRRASTRNRQRR